MPEILKCMATGIASMAAMAVGLWLSYALLPYSAYLFCVLLLLFIATALGADLRSGRCPR